MSITWIVLGLIAGFVGSKLVNRGHPDAIRFTVYEDLYLSA